MAVQLNHTIVAARDAERSAQFLADILGLPAPVRWGPFVPVKTGNGVTMDFIDGESEVRMQHYAFLVSDAEFDSSFARLEKAGLPYWADPHKAHPGEINRHWGGRGVYFEDPNGHLLELITKPYGDLGALNQPT
jgi:catechol 2,3-dioxygenase-like lactoylglutathione lyase family enzyme